MASPSEEELNKKLIEFENLRQQYLEYEKITLEIEKNIDELETAIQEIQNASDEKNIYKLIGNVLVKKDKQSLLSELQEKKQIMEANLKHYKNKTEELNQRLKALYDEIRKYTGKSNLITK